MFFDISEDDPRWQDVQRLISQYGPEEHLDKPVWTVFTQEERNEAAFLTVGACWTHGFPEPSGIEAVPGTNYLPFFAASYDVSSYCLVCGSGARQKAPIHMKKELSWGRRSIMKLNWLTDELFVQPRVWEAVFRPFGVDCQPVLLYETGARMESVVQLIIPRTATLDVSGLPCTVCTRCGRSKYAPVCRGFMPAPLQMDGAMGKSQECFGDNGFAFNQILAARVLYEQIRDAGLKGAEFQPCDKGHGSS